MKTLNQHSMAKKLALLVAGAAVLLTAACSASTEAKSAPLPGEGIGAGGVAGDKTNAAPVQPCTGDATSSITYPGALPQPGSMPGTGTLAIIQQRGFLIAGIDLNTLRFGFDTRQTNTPQDYKGFDVDIARQIAKAIFGDENKIQFRVVTLADPKGITDPKQASGEVSQLNNGNVDVVVRTTTITCKRILDANFSNPYYIAQQRLLVPIGSGITSIDDLKGKNKKVCASAGSTALSVITAHLGDGAAYGATNSLDCLALLQENKVDAVSTDDALLRGMADQDKKVEIVGGSLGDQPYGIVTGKKDKDFSGFVNGVLAKMFADQTWAKLYAADLGTQPAGIPAVPDKYPLGQ